MEMIVASCSDGGIGKNNTIPWHIKDDLKLFRTITKSVLNPNMTNVVIMGRKTWESIPEKYRPLQGRINIILSTTMKETNEFLNEYEHTYIVDSFKNMIKRIEYFSTKYKLYKIFIIGGSKIYEESFDKCYINKVHISYINEKYECDTFFPLHNIFKCYTVKTTNKYKDFTYVCYEKK